MCRENDRQTKIQTARQVDRPIQSNTYRQNAMSILIETSIPTDRRKDSHRQMNITYLAHYNTNSDRQTERQIDR